MTVEPREQWIWLPEKQFPEKQTTIFTPLYSVEGRAPNYTVVKISRTYSFNQKIQSAAIRFSGDTYFILNCNGKTVARGPACVGGDFLCNDRPRPQYYATESVLTDVYFADEMTEKTLTFEATVRMSPILICEYSKGHGGFFLDGRVIFEDGSETVIGTDEEWTIQLLTEHAAAAYYDETIEAAAPVKAERIDNVWHTLTSPIPPCTLELKYPEGEYTLTVRPGETLTKSFTFDKIYAGYFYTAVSGNVQKVTVSAACCEMGTGGRGEKCVFCREGSYEGTLLYSVGEYHVTVTNEGDAPVSVLFALLASFYPIETQAKTFTSDEEINHVLEVCAHTLKYCRQSIHLDSPLHCEPLACAGDYYVEMLMTIFTYGDQRLSSFDVRRIAQLLRYNDGRLFHTTYSLIWVQMLYEAYLLTADKALLSDTEDALILLLNRFDTYLGDNGLVETPPDYMFIDWLEPDGISTHHPPKALGQTCMNLFLYGALKTAKKIFDALCKEAMAAKCNAKAESLRTAILAHLYDEERGLFFEGLNTPTEERLLYQFMPQNVEKRYYRRHANILAAYFGILPEEDCVRILEKIQSDDTLGEVQPYFMHYWLEAVMRNGLREQFTLPLIDMWRAPIAECDRGLPEGFYRPEPTYCFDHSHAWGGTPVYALPLALTGLQILEPGFKKIALSPSLLHFTHATVEIPTPFGMITVSMKKGEKTVVSAPKEINIVLL